MVVKSNWTVCKQTPAAGTAIDGSPTLHVERQCAPGATPAGTRSNTTPATTTETTSTLATPTAEPVLTPRTSNDLRAMLKVSDYCDAAVGRFAKKYEWRTIRFNGSAVTLANHGDYKTRHDILVSPKSGGPADTGPAPQFRDVNFSDLDLQGTDTIAKGDRFQFTATVGEYSTTGCLLQLDPTTTELASRGTRLSPRSPSRELRRDGLLCEVAKFPTNTRQFSSQQASREDPPERDGGEWTTRAWS